MPCIILYVIEFLFSFDVFFASEMNQQRICIKIRTKIERENITKIYKTIKTVLQNDSLSRSKIFERFGRFKDGVTRLRKITYVDHPRSN